MRKQIILVIAIVIISINGCAKKNPEEYKAANATSKSEEYLEGLMKVSFSNGTDNPTLYITLEHAKIACEISAIEKEIEMIKKWYKVHPRDFDFYQENIQELESEIDGCEYFENTYSSNSTLTHKGNCKNNIHWIKK